MLEIAGIGNLPTYIEHTYHISNPHSRQFWEDREFLIDKELLLEEWECVTSASNRYEKVLYGTKFTIQFTYDEKTKS